MTYDILVFSTDKTHFLVFYLWPFGLCISDKTLFLVFDILLLGVWISDKTLLVIDIYNFSMFGYHMKYSFWCLIYHLSLFGYRIKQFSVFDVSLLLSSLVIEETNNHSLLSLKLLRVWTTAIQQDCKFLFWANEIKLGFSNDLTTSYLSFSLNEDIKSVWLNSG